MTNAGGFAPVPEPALREARRLFDSTPPGLVDPPVDGDEGLASAAPLRDRLALAWLREQFAVEERRPSASQRRQSMASNCGA